MSRNTKLAKRFYAAVTAAAMTLLALPAWSIGAETEENDSASTATALTFGTAMTGNLSASTDVDFYALTVEEAGYFTLNFSHATQSSSDASWRMVLLNTDGVSEITNWDCAANAASVDTTKLAMSKGTYYVKVLHPSYKTFYDIDYTLLADFTADANRELEDNNTSSAASKLPLNTKTSGNLFTSSDVDFYELNITEAGYFNLNFSHATQTSSSVSWRMTLLNSDGAAVIANWDCAANVASLDTTKLSMGIGTYYVKVQRPDYKDYFSVDYTLLATFTADAERETEPNDTSSIATPLALNTTITGSLFTTEDVDYYQFDVTEDGYFVIDFQHLTQSDTAVCWQVQLYGSDAATKLYTLDSAANAADLMSNKLNMPQGTYYLAVYRPAYKTYFSIDYKLAVNFTADAAREIESNDTVTNATVLSLNTAISGSLFMSSDVDMYQFEVKDAGYFVLSVDHKTMTSTENSWRAVLMAADGVTELVTLNAPANVAASSSNKLNFAAGTYYVKVFNPTYEDYFAEDYIIHVDFTADATREIEANETVETAELLTLGTPMTGSFFKSADVDYYRFEITENGYFQLTLNHPAQTSTENSWSMTLCKEDGVTQIATWNAPANTPSTVTPKLNFAPGTYYIKAYRPDYQDYFADDYTLSVDFTADALREIESNDTKENATVLPLETVYNGNICVANDKADYYKITTTEPGYFIINIAHESQTSDAVFWYCNLYADTAVTDSLLQLEVPGHLPLVSSRELGYQPGDYYVVITHPSSFQSIDYQISVNFVPAVWEVEPNNTIEHATPLTLDVPVGGYRTDNNDEDYFTLTLDETSNVLFSFEHETFEGTEDYWNILILADDGVTEVASVKSNAERLTELKASLPAGTYYVHVTKAGYYYATYNYTLTASILTYTRGDVDENGVIDANDAVALLKSLAVTMLGKPSPLSDNQLLAADVDQNGELTTYDASLILRFYSANMIRVTTWEDILA